MSEYIRCANGCVSLVSEEGAICASCQHRKAQLDQIRSPDRERIAELEAELAEAKAFAASLSDALDKTNRACHYFRNRADDLEAGLKQLGK